MEWVYKILIILGFAIGGFFVGKYYYDTPIVPPEVHTQADTTETFEAVVDTVWEDRYTVLMDTTILHDTVYVEVKMAQDVYETNFQHEFEMFKVKMTLKTDTSIKPFILEKPKFSYNYTTTYNTRLTLAHDEGYRWGYSEGHTVGLKKNNVKNIAISGGVGLLLGVVLGGMAL